MLGMPYEKWLVMWNALDGPNCDKPCPKCRGYTPSTEGKYGEPCKVCAPQKVDICVNAQ